MLRQISESLGALRATSPARRRSFAYGRTNSLLRRNSNPSQLRLGRYPTTRGSDRMSPRGWYKFLFAGFRQISVTRLLSLQSKTEKKTGILCTKQPLCAVFYGGFLLFEAVRPRNLAAGTEKSGPRKRNSRPRKFFSKPRNFFPGPVFLRRRLGSTFSRYLELFHRQIPDVNMSAQAPPGLRAPVIPARKQPAPATKRKPAPSICRHLGFRTFRETAFFAPATAPCPVQVNLRGLQMTKCQIPGEIAKCQIRRSVSGDSF